MAWRMRKPDPLPRLRSRDLAPVAAGMLGGMILFVAQTAETAVTPPSPPAVELAVALTPPKPLEVPAPPAPPVTLRLAAFHVNVPVPRPRPVIEPPRVTEMPAGPEAPAIALIVDDMGLDPDRSARIVRLAAPVTLSYLPYAEGVREQAHRARAAGHELLVHLPMESRYHSMDPGPHALTVAQTPAENLRRLDWALGRFDGYVGINNHMGSRFTASRRSLGPVLREVKRRGLFFVDSLTVRNSVVDSSAMAIGLPVAVRDIFIDHVDEPPKIRRRLAELERLARETGRAIGIGHPRDNTIAILEDWVPAAKRRGFRFIPVSQAVERAPLISAPRLPTPDHGPA